MYAYASVSVRFLSAWAALAWAAPAAAQGLKADVDPPVIEHIEDTTTVEIIQPTNTMQGTRGLPQTASAEALGEGRLVLGLNGPWYRQQRSYAGAPNAKADIFTGIGSVAYGIGRQWDIFASLTAWGTQNYHGPQGSGLGTIQGGVQGTLPFTPAAPIRMGAQFAVINGLSDNPIDSNYADGYNYFETRTGLDFRGTLMQTLVAGSEATSLKMHFNEGVATSMESGVDPLLLLGTGLQMNVPMAALGLELHSRTALNDVNFRTDPVWLTPSIQFRSLYSMNLTLGGDIALSRERSGPATEVALRALEPYRLFGGIAFSFDTWAEKRRQEKWEALRAAREREILKTQAIAAAQKAREDSIAAANAHTQINNITVQNDQLSEKARQDSLALADAQRRLAEERSKRTDLENQLLTTGVLVMDAVYFETGKAEISLNSKPYLTMLAKMLAKYPKLRVEVDGHTDNVGSDAYNMNLSQARASAVRDYMVSQVPELGDRLTARGYGESSPKADNRTADGRKLNRRTELQVLNKDALREYNEPVVSGTPSTQPAAGTATAPMGGTPAGSGAIDETKGTGAKGIDSTRSPVPYDKAGTGTAPRGGTPGGSGSVDSLDTSRSLNRDSAGTPIPSPLW
jgi:outer membrane protein OmpA-like peptidoglycan-associated protein